VTTRLPYNRTVKMSKEDGRLPMIICVDIGPKYLESGKSFAHGGSPPEHDRLDPGSQNGINGIGFPRESVR
jgi:hypothetical protein